MINDAAYWISIAHLPRWRSERINKLIIEIYHYKKSNLEEFFSLNESDWISEYELNLQEIEALKISKSEISNNAFIAETLQNEGYELIPITSEDYSKTLKDNLKVSYSPPLLYLKGDKEILQENSLAIVGSRNASEISLLFTDQIAEKASLEKSVVVSGFAPGVDKQALESAIKYHARSIIVLPQGIMTFTTGYRTYYKQIIEGEVLLLSTFFPKAPWRVELAMARNPVIYGLAKDIYVAESSDKGGTWSGVIDGLRKNRIIYVRKPSSDENNANDLLIMKGAIPVNSKGVPVSDNSISDESIISSKPSTLPEKVIEDDIESVSNQDKIIDLLKTGEFSVSQIKENLNLTWDDKKINHFLKNNNSVFIIKKRPLKFTIASNTSYQTTIFDIDDHSE